MPTPGTRSPKSPPQQRRNRIARPLTARQTSVLHLVVEGLTNREIASELQLSVRTIEVHRYHLMRRLQARNVAQLVRQAFTFGLVPRRLIPV